MGGPDEKDLERAMLVQWHAPLGLPSTAPVPCDNKTSCYNIPSLSTNTESIKKCSSGVFLALEMPWLLGELC